MSRFFEAGSDSDSDSTQSDEPERFQQPKLTAAAFAVSPPSARLWKSLCSLVNRYLSKHLHGWMYEVMICAK